MADRRTVRELDLLRDRAQLLENMLRKITNNYAAIPVHGSKDEDWLQVQESIGEAHTFLNSFPHNPHQLPFEDPDDEQGYYPPRINISWGPPPPAPAFVKPARAEEAILECATRLAGDVKNGQVRFAVAANRLILARRDGDGTVKVFDCRIERQCVVYTKLYEPTEEEATDHKVLYHGHGDTPGIANDSGRSGVLKTPKKND